MIIFLLLVFLLVGCYSFYVLRDFKDESRRDEGDQMEYMEEYQYPGATGPTLYPAQIDFSQYTGISMSGNPAAGRVRPSRNSYIQISSSSGIYCGTWRVLSDNDGELTLQALGESPEGILGEAILSEDMKDIRW